MNTENYYAQEAKRIIGLQVDSESLESIAVAIEALVNSNLAVAYEARIANLLKMVEVKVMPVPGNLDISWAAKDVAEIKKLMEN